MQVIWITTVAIVVIGIVVAAALVFVGNKFHVEVDERENAIREVLPGNNCGACGFAGCDAVAEAIAKGEAQVNVCPVGGEVVAKQIGKIMGVDADALERNVAFVRCSGNCHVTRNQGNYVGIHDCRVAVHAGIQVPECDYGCYGLGSCVIVCPHDAIHVIDGVAVVDRRKCVGCGLCAKACPKKLIDLIPEHQHVLVACSNRDRGQLVRNICSQGCIGCMLCSKVCESGAVSVSDNLARIDSGKCIQCGKCVERCPVHAIRQVTKEA